MRRAVIDVGSNTVKLLVAEVRGGEILPVVCRDRASRLGEGLHETGRLSAVAMARTADAVAELLAEARTHGALEVTALTTSAAREAANGDEFREAVRARCGVTVEVISGEREADLIFQGVASDPVWAAGPLLVLDVGGGSVEAIQGHGNSIERRLSLPFGAVRMLEKFGETGGPELGRFLRAELGAALAGYDRRGRRVIGTGGTITTLAAVGQGRAGGDAVRVDHAVLSVAKIHDLVATLAAMPLPERKRVPGLPPARADIIVPGGAVFLAALEVLGAAELTVSTRSLRYGALLV